MVFLLVVPGAPRAGVAVRVERRPLRSRFCGRLSAAVKRRHTMAKRGRKRRARKKNAANHGKRPNA
jgi:hypothetical protein